MIKNKFIQSHKEFLAFSVFFFGFIWYCSGNIFFWDTAQLGSEHAFFYYDNSLKLSLLPDKYDSGHIPTFGYVLAILWKIFGKTLAVSHFYILPFAIGIVWQLAQILKQFIPKKFLFWAMLLVLMDTTFLSQVSLVSPDIPLLFFFLLALNSILKNNSILLSVAIASLFLISMRGMILTVPLFLFHVYLNKSLDFKSLKNTIVNLFKIGIPYIPATVIFIGFNWFHYSEKGWFGYHENSPWAVFFERVNFTGAIKNFAIFGFRLLDFGRVFLWLTFGIIAVIMLRKKEKIDEKAKQLFVLFGLIIFFLSIPAIIYLDLKGHRYFMPIYFAISFLVSYLLFTKIQAVNLRKVLFFACVIGLFSGNFWVYPKKMSQGWDSTLAHLPYYNLRKNMLHFIERNNLPTQEIGYDFPGGYEQRYLDLSEETWSFPEADLSKHNYILYASVVNDFKDEELDELENNWEIIHHEKSITVEMILYQKK